MDDSDRKALYIFFRRLGLLISRVLVPGGNVVVASNSLLAHIVASAMTEGGLQLRGTLVRLTMTMRGGDRPKNAHREFEGVSVMPPERIELAKTSERELDLISKDDLGRLLSAPNGNTLSDLRDRAILELFFSRALVKVIQEHSVL